MSTIAYLARHDLVFIVVVATLEILKRLVVVFGFMVVIRLVLEKFAPHHLVHPGWRDRHQLIRELKTLVAIGFFSLIPFSYLFNYLAGAQLILLETGAIADLSTFQWVKGALFILGFDLYFYVLHRVLHTPWLFRKIHYVHHLSKIPQPLTGFCVHPVEGLLLQAYVVLVTLFIPIHPVFFFALSWGFIFLTVYVHSGIVLFPGVWRKPLFSFFITAKHHDLHHSEVNSNYGMGLNVWDKVCGTNSTAYRNE